jgi:hypothetical protein
MYIAIGKVNRRLPVGQRISYLRWGMRNVKEQYQRLYPQGKLIFVFYACGALMTIFLLASFFVPR